MSENIGKLGVFKLSLGAHGKPQEGVCAMEAVAWLAGEEHSDAPECACPLIGAMVRAINDAIEDDRQRQRLIPFLPRIIGSKPVKDHPEKGRRVIKLPRLYAMSPVSEIPETEKIEYEVLDKIFDAEGVLRRGRVLYQYMHDYSVYMQPGMLHSALVNSETMLSRGCFDSAVSMAEAIAAGTIYFNGTFNGVDERGQSIVLIKEESLDRALEMLDVALNAGPQGQCDYDYGPAVERYRRDVLEVA